MRLWFMTLRNVGRHPRRNFITASSVALGVWLSVLVVGVRDDTYGRLIDAAASTGFGHLTIDGGGGDKGLVSARQVPSDLPSEVQVLPRIQADALLSVGIQAGSAQLIGVDFSRETKSTNLFLRSMVEHDESVKGCLLGHSLAKTLKIGVGKKLILSTTDVNQGVVTELLRVRGIFRTGNRDLDLHTVIVPLDDAQTILGMTADQVSFYSVFLQDQAKIEKLQQRLAMALPQTLRVKTWKETVPELANVLLMDRIAYRVVLAFIGFIIALGILSTMMMNVMERMREFGVMQALGVGPRQIFAVIVAEAVTLAVLGLLLGALVVSPFYYALHTFGIDLRDLVGGQLDVGGVSLAYVLHCTIQPINLMMIGGALLVYSLLASLIPALRAARARPLAAMGGG